jgi:ABC-2 type transport system permease protein
LLEGLGNVVVKEVKELIRDPKILIGMILVPLLMFPLMGLAVQIATQTAVESIKTMSIGVIDQDGGLYAQILVNAFSSSNLTIIRLAATNIDDVAKDVQESNMTAVVVIPEGFSQNITDDMQAKVHVYGVFRATGIAETAGPSTVVSIVGSFSRYLALQKVGNNTALLEPISSYQESIVKGKAVSVSPSTLSTLVLSQYIGLPIGISVLLVFAMQIAATSVASEKEEKTLETMLTMPVGRFTILLGKLAGSVIVAAVGAIAYVAGVNYYMSSFTFGFQTELSVDLASVGLAPTLPAYLVLGASLFVTLVSALALAIAVSSFSEDVRSAQSVVGYFYLILFIPMIFLMYTDINMLPLAVRLVLLAIPYTHPMLAARASFTGDYTTAVLGIIYVTIFTLVVLYIAAKIFTTEKILTMRLRLRRQKPKRTE